MGSGATGLGGGCGVGAMRVSAGFARGGARGAVARLFALALFLARFAALRRELAAEKLRGSRVEACGRAAQRDTMQVVQVPIRLVRGERRGVSD